MKNNLSGNYKKEYNFLASIIKTEVASGTERDNVLEELYLLFEAAEKNKEDIQTLYGNSREAFVKDILEVLPKNKYKNIVQLGQRLALILLCLVALLLTLALGMNLYYSLCTPDTVIIGGAFATTSIYLASSGYGIGLCLFGLIFVIILILVIKKNLFRKEI
ncbi:MAG: hypothetical protein J6I97_04410 [Agathobacter sp.]|nr:hypothetical protein [Agathobacter sp.]